jgi:chemotaxis response regulator CheB
MYITDTALRRVHNQSEGTAEFLVLSRMSPVPEVYRNHRNVPLIGKKRSQPSIFFAPLANGVHSMAPRRQSGKQGGNATPARRRRAASTAFDVTAPHSREGAAVTRLVVGLGASPGGLDAFKSFFTNMPPKNGMAFILVQLLDPHHKSLLVELLSSHTEMPVVQATDGMAVAADHVFIIPPNAVMTIKGGILRVSTPAPPREHRKPIDVFFASLAEDQEEKAICIILSGSGSDGSLGLKAVKEHGGFSLAQAGFDETALLGMPSSAAATGLVDAVMPVGRGCSPTRSISAESAIGRRRTARDATRRNI